MYILNIVYSLSAREMGNHLNRLLGYEPKKKKNYWSQKLTLTEKVSRWAILSFTSIYKLLFSLLSLMN